MLHERRNLQVNLDLNQIKALCEPYIQEQITVATLIRYGLSNTNYRLVLKNNKSYLLRVHNNKNKALIEYKLNQTLCRLTDKVPVMFDQFDDVSIQHTCSIIEFLPGQPLSSISNPMIQSELFKELANFIGILTQYKFDTPGQLNTQLKPMPFATEETSHHPYVNFMLDCLNRGYITKNTSTTFVNKIQKFIIEHESLLDDIPSEDTHLTHGDFKLENILVVSNNNIAKLAGIVDWEYARSDSLYTDIATLFRNYFPKIKENIVLEGFTSELERHKCSLASNWFVIAKYVDFINLLSLLDSQFARKNLFKSIYCIINDSISFIQNY